MKRFKALIFDVDGTLAETEEIHRRAFNDAFRISSCHGFGIAVFIGHCFV